MTSRSAGLAIAAGRLAVAVHDSDADHVEVVGTSTLSAACRSDVLTELQNVVAELVSVHGGVVGVGVSVGGHVSQDGRRVRFAPGLVQSGIDWVDEPLADLLEERIRMPVFVENDVNCMCGYQRAYGSAKDVDDVIVVYLAPNVEGLGCAVVASGRLIRGGTGGAGEFGHIVIQPDGPSCRCGNRGCLEAMVAVENFVRDINWGNRASVSDFTSAAEMLHGADAHRARRVFERSGRYLGQGLATAVNLLNPRVIVLGGPPELVGTDATPDSESSALFMRGVHAAMAENTFSRMAAECEIRRDRLDLGTAACGAALLLDERLRDAPDRLR